MKFFLLFSVTLLFSACASLFPVDWSIPTRRIQASLVRINHPVTESTFIEDEQDTFIGENGEIQVICSGFVIHSIKEYVLTAEHCAGENILVDGKKSWAVYHNKDNDLMVLRVEQLKKPAVYPCHNALVTGTPMGAIGYGYGLSKPLFRAGYIAHQEMLFSGLSGLWLTFDGPYIGGMSGGPVYNTHGHVIGIVQLSDNFTGIGKDISSIQQVTRQYWEF